MNLQPLVEFFSSGRGQLALALVGVALGLVPLLKHLVITPRRITNRVHYNSRIGISANDSTKLISRNDGLQAADRQALQTIRLLDRMSIVVIRIQNTSSFPIAAGSFEEPLSFTFGKRVVWNARISEARDSDVRDLIVKHMQFFDADPEVTEPGKPPAEAKPESADVHRQRLLERILWIIRPPVPSGPSAPPEPAPVVEAQYHGVRLSKVELKRKERFKLVVVLYEPFDLDADTSDNVEIDKTVVHNGHLSNGEIQDDKKRTRVTVPRIAGSLAVVLFTALIVSLLVGPPARDTAIQCASGTLRVVGSSVFMPVVASVADRYSDQCDGGPRITTDATGSKKGLLELNGPNVNPAELALVHDGEVGSSGGLERHPVAVSIYSIAVHESVSARGVKALTTRELQRIWSGEIRFWDDLPGAAPAGEPKLPIRIVSRGAESGSRSIFEDRILGTPEGNLTSDDCAKRKAGVPETSVIRCERDDNKSAIAEISAIEGAIGYADVPPTNPERKSRKVVPVSLDGVYPDISNIQRAPDQGYRFWTIENIYTKGKPADGARLKYFLDYLAGAEGSRHIQAAGYAPCVNADGTYHPLCQ